MSALSPAAAAAWFRAGRYYWTYGNWTICLVMLSGRRRFELWRNGQLVAADDNAEALREMVEQRESPLAAEAD